MFLYFLILLSHVKFWDYNLKDYVELLLIGPEEVRSICQDYVEYKNRIGIPSTFISVEEIGRDFPGADIPDKIRNAIRFYRENLHTRYVLLLGDFVKLPSKVVYVRFSPDDFRNNIPTDFYFSELYSDWDKNKNGVFGERGDSISLMPNVMVGRIPYHSPDELADFFQRLKLYKTLFSYQYSPSVLLHASDVDNSGSFPYYYLEPIARVVPPNFTIRRLYETGLDPNGSNISKALFVQNLNLGNSYILSIAHGDFENLYINQTPQVAFGVVDQRLVSSPVPSFWLSISCEVGGYDRDAFFEHFLFNPSTIGVLTQTRDGMTNTYVFLKTFLDALLNNPYSSLGEADSIMRATHAPDGEQSTLFYYSLLTFILFGDPSFVPQKTPYRRYSFQSVSMVNDTLLKVVINGFESSNDTVKKRLVIYKSGEMLKVAELESDSVYLPVSVASPGYLYVTLTGYGLYDVTDSIYVFPLLNPVSVDIKGWRNEYGDSIIVDNASFELFLKVRNESSKFLDTVEITLKSDSIVEIDNPLFRFSLMPFETRLLEVHGHVAPLAGDTAFTFSIFWKMSGFENSKAYTIPVHKPKLSVDFLRVLKFRDSLSLEVKFSNQSLIPIRDIKFSMKKPFDSTLLYLRSLSSGETGIYSFCLPYSDYLTLTLYYLRDSLVFSPEFNISLLPPPYNLSFSPGPSSVALRWQFSGQNVVFNVYKSYDGTNFLKINRTFLGSPYFVDNDVHGTAYYYVTAVDTIVHVESPPSETVRVTPNPSFYPGWPQPVLGSGYSTPVVCELDTTRFGLETVVGSSFDSLVYAFDQFGNLLPGWPVNVRGTVFSAIAVGNLDGNGEEEVIFTTWNGRRALHVLNKWGEELQGFPVPITSYGVTTPVVIDLNGDGNLEIVLKDGDTLRVINGFGQQVFSRYFGGGNYAPQPACGDVDGDGHIEIVCAYSTPSSGFVNVLSGVDFQSKPGFPVRISKTNITTPSIADLIPESPGDEIVVGAGDSLYIISSTGTILRKFYAYRSTYWPFAISPAVGDVDGDGLKDIAIPYSEGLAVFSVYGELLPGFPVNCGGGFSSCIIWDVEGDGRGEVFKGSVDSKLYAFNYLAQALPGFPIDLFSYAYPTPQVVDLNLDGNMELLASSWANTVLVFDTRFSSILSQWPMYMHDRHRTGWYGYVDIISGVGEGSDSDFYGFESLEGKVLVYDVMGRVIFDGNFETLENSAWKGFKRGIYFIKFQKTGKVVKRVVLK